MATINNKKKVNSILLLYLVEVELVLSAVDW